MVKPTVVIITGPSGSGKTTIAQKTSEVTKLPVFCKDAIKEELFNSLGVLDRDWSKKMGGTSYDLLFYTAIQMLKVGKSVIIESNFTDYHLQKFHDLQKQYNCCFVKIHLFADLEILKQRFADRWESGNRHRGHLDNENMNIFTADTLNNHSLLELNCPTFNINTSDFAKIDMLALYSFLTKNVM